MPQNIYEVVWIFVIYAFLGWCCEVIFAAVTVGRFVNRGFLNGPVCPIYGFGMLMTVGFLWNLRRNVILFFLAAALLTTLLEFFTGFILERFFRTKWWDYSDKPFNIKGYVCPEFTIIWGLGACLAVGAVHPFVYMAVTKFPFLPGVIILSVLAAAFISDTVITAVNLAGLTRRLNRLLELEKGLRIISDKLGENISDTALAAKAKGGELIGEGKPKLKEIAAEYEKKKAEYKKLLESRNIVHRRILKAFPKLSEGRYRAAFERLNEIKKKTAKRKKNGKDSM